MNAAKLTEVYNPFNDTHPSLGPFQPVIGSKVGMAIGLVWAIGFIYAGYHLISGFARLARAKSNGYADVLDDARRELGLAAASLIGLSSLPVIFTVLTS